jgi:hypothetical protein
MYESLIVLLDDQKLAVTFIDQADLYNTIFLSCCLHHLPRALVFIHPLLTPSAPTPPTNTKFIMGGEQSKLDTALIVALLLLAACFHLVFCYFWEANECKPGYDPQLARPFVPRPGYSTNPLIDYLQLQEAKIAKREGIPILPDNQGLPAVVKRGIKGEFPWQMPTRHPSDTRSLGGTNYVCLLQTPNITSGFSTAYTFTGKTHEGDGTFISQPPHPLPRLFRLLLALHILGLAVLKELGVQRMERIAVFNDLGIEASFSS